jgi:hypothetical protein
VTVPPAVRNGKQIDAACEVRDAIRRGQYLICEQRQQQIRFYLSGGGVVPRSIAELVLADPRIIAAGDSLFPGIALSQTYGWRR